VWICVNCEAENDPADTICNVCSVPLSPRDKKAAPIVKLVDRGDWPRGLWSAPPRVVLGASHTLNFVAIGGVCVIAFFVVVAGNSLESKHDASIAARGSETTNLVLSESDQSEKMAEREDQTYRSAQGTLTRLRVYRDSCTICKFRSEATAQIETLEREEFVQRESSIYANARGNIAALRSYLTSCQVCAFRMEADEEITQIERQELAQRETQVYLAARGSADRLQSYAGNCNICDFRNAALDEIRDLERPFIPTPIAPTAWNYNGSSIRLESTNEMRRFVYVEPREGLREVGVTSGMVAFEGTRKGNVYEGTAFVFSQKCGAIGYPVKGFVAPDDRSVTMKGYAPYVNSECKISGGRDGVLVFELVGN
jgi:hypothetical protein